MVKHSGFASCEGLLPVSKRLKVSPAIRYNRHNQGLSLYYNIRNLLPVVQQNDFLYALFFTRAFSGKIFHTKGRIGGIIGITE